MRAGLRELSCRADIQPPRGQEGGVNWAQFAAAAPELAALGRAALEEQHLSILGTLRADGWPRISPCEVYFVGDELMLGMMRNSKKSRDLRRDPRITLSNGQSKRIPKHGDFKAYGRAVEVTDPDKREAYGRTIFAAIDWRPEEPFPLFALDIERAGYISFGKGHRVMRWTADGGLEQLRHPDDPDEAG
jgi:hypothetical protein